MTASEAAEEAERQLFLGLTLALEERHAPGAGGGEVKGVGAMSGTILLTPMGCEMLLDSTSRPGDSL